jgi:hypothetical protein
VRSVQDKPFVEDLDVLTYQQSETIIIMLNASDADGDPLFFYDDTELFDIHEFNGEINFTANRDMAGTYDIIITVSDGDLQTEMEFTLVIERFNRPPDLLFIKDVTVKVGQEISIEAIATDPDGDPLEFTTDPPIFTVTKNNDTSATLKYTPTKHDVGPKNIIIRASDGLEDDSQTILVTVVEDKEGDDKAFALNPLFLSILLIIIIIIIVVVLLVKRKKKQADRDMKAWGSLETVELDDDEVGFEAPPELPVRPDGEYSVIEEELMDSAMQSRRELEGGAPSPTEEPPMSLPPTAETLYPEKAEVKELTTPPIAETEIVLKPPTPPPPPPPEVEAETEEVMETEEPKKPRPVKKKVKKKKQ